MLKKHPFLASILILFALLLIFTGLLNVTQQERFAFWQQGVIGVIKIQGVILDPDPIVAQIEKMERTDSVLGVIVRLNSPGGSVVAAQEIYDRLKRLQSAKPIYASMGSIAASGAYYIACATDRIFANPGTITGSIGVLLQWFNFQDLANKVGAKTLTIKSVQNKDLMSMFREIEEAERHILQQLVDDTHEQFIQAILQGREQAQEEQIREWADGRILAGERARALGMIDELASYPQVLQTMGEELGLDGAVRTIEFDEREFSLNSLLGLAALKEILPIASGIRLSYLLE